MNSKLPNQITVANGIGRSGSAIWENDGKNDVGTQLPLPSVPTIGVRSRGGPKPTSECCVSLTRMVMQGEYTGVYPGSGKRRPYVQRGGESFVFPYTEVLV
jgi:hypothetical protein